MTTDEVNESYRPGDPEWGVGFAEAAVEVAWHFQRFDEAKTVFQRCSALMDLCNAMSDMQSWLPGWDWKSGTMPWERNEDE